jgi:hypothetical protein
MKIFFNQVNRWSQGKKRNLLLFALILNKYETIEALRQLEKRESARQTLRKNTLRDF